MKTFVELVEEIKKSFDQEDNKILSAIEDNIELTSTATLPHAVGTYLVLDKVVYKVTTAIATGDTIEEGVNVTVADDIMTMIAALETENQTLANQVKDMNNVYGAKNLLPLKVRTGTTYGITVTSDSDDNVIVNGTSTGNPAQISLFDTVAIRIGEGESILLKDLGIDTSKQYVLARATKVTNLRYKIEFLEGTTSLGSFQLGNNQNLYRDIPFSDYPTCDRIKAAVVIPISTTFSNEKITPMICLKSVYDLDSTYVPYAKTNQQLTEDTTALLDNLEVNGAVNMLPPRGISEVITGITFTANSDGSISASGTATANTYYNVPVADVGQATKAVSGKIVKMSGCPSGGSASTYALQAYIRTSSDGNVSGGQRDDFGNGTTFTVGSDQSLRVQIFIASGQTVSLTFKPMITVPSYNGDYVPYAKSNKELTDLWDANKYVEYDISGGTSSLDFTNATRKLLVNTFTRHCMICVQNVITTTAFNVGDAIALGDIPFSSYIPKYNVYGSGRALNGTTLYKTFFSKNNVNVTFAMNCYEDIPVGTSISMSIEWSY